MTDMTVKEFAYYILRNRGCIRESTLRRRLLEVYPEACVDCILREIREDKEHVRTVHVIDDTPQLTEYDTPQETYFILLDKQEDGA